MTSCVYGPLGAPPGSSTLIGSRDVSDSTVELRALLNGLPVVPEGQVFSCPFDNGSQIVLRFTYPDGRHVIVAINLTGCQFARNGLVKARTTVQAQAVLSRLFGVAWGPS
ncbi:MAG: hypothetical protein E6G47_03125 [Actinobacteria bacterium]|nr:MAG: hypothetical protein E6G47_03125 [Actinomycetota bacterium]